ncbi:putative mitochondrial protein (mitochondrion) [Arabidopsis thaliana]|uniref:Uncharacterized mitochondrial protein AtMg00680 n=3 Tax=Arabidopsis TaxID=3701 RepID=M680_ARATH|nr:RecName: Full=Uncharacterized mitochondrial protein AtMg00680; AltName: Full=ORF122c [Arabidopsis thaliana]KAG7528020.1 hypothetical protein ISN44_Un231g000020 [Arabidopsis suecica]KAG7528754.1 hypothetical protein ISN44_Un159g000170 [Arabidopsis suecica]KAG7529227.1 hypothetical protein ISN45_Un97g000050 [Arabidopsis thaliana x Arabidopsis arenosa]CAA69843.1 unnamed protein product [Arabidopsis thaliana]
MKHASFCLSSRILLLAPCRYLGTLLLLLPYPCSTLRQFLFLLRSLFIRDVEWIPAGLSHHIPYFPLASPPLTVETLLIARLLLSIKQLSLPPAKTASLSASLDAKTKGRSLLSSCSYCYMPT